MYTTEILGSLSLMLASSISCVALDLFHFSMFVMFAVDCAVQRVLLGLENPKSANPISLDS